MPAHVMLHTDTHTHTLTCTSSRALKQRQETVDQLRTIHATDYMYYASCLLPIVGTINTINTR